MSAAMNGRGSLHMLEDGSTWVGYVSFGHDAEGRRLRKKVRGRTESEVQAKVERLITAWANGQARP